MTEVKQVSTEFALGNRKQMTGKNSAFSSWYQHQVGNCLHNVLSLSEKWVPVILRWKSRTKSHDL